MKPFRRAFSLRVGPSPVARELDDELAFHLDMRTKRLIESGMTPDAARPELSHMSHASSSYRRGAARVTSS